jgi:uncharacterized membrane protein (UPF0127 family)
MSNSICFRFATCTLLALLCAAELSYPLAQASSGKAVTSKIAPSPHLSETPLQIGKHTYTLEVTKTFKESQLGLMGRTSLTTGHGMLFTFFPPEPARFWMRHTLIPLDMLFIADSKIIYIQEAAPPCPRNLGDQCPTYGPDALVDYVVELPAHTARRDGLKPGARIGKQP